MWIYQHIVILHVVCKKDFLRFISFLMVSVALLDIPVYESRIQSLHALFTLYLGFKNSEV
jgi:hypothetical protein